MIQDPLTHSERVRLEALSQANALSPMVLVITRSGSAKVEDVFRLAEKIEAWLLRSNLTTDHEKVEFAKLSEEHNARQGLPT